MKVINRNKIIEFHLKIQSHIFKVIYKYLKKLMINGTKFQIRKIIN